MISNTISPDEFYVTHLNRVFVPNRVIIEMDTMTSLCLTGLNYDHLRNIPDTRPTREALIEVLEVTENPVHEKIVDFFYNFSMNRVKPVVAYSREHHGIDRRGNVIPYTKTRTSALLALHLLKLKLMLINQFVLESDDNKWNVDWLTRRDTFLNEVGHQKFQSQSPFIQTLGNTFHYEYSKILEQMLPDNENHQQKTNPALSANSITNPKILEMGTFLFYDETTKPIKFLIRTIKASHFLTHLLIANMDIQDVFFSPGGSMVDGDEMAVSQDFLPAILPAISQALEEKNWDKVADFMAAFELIMNAVLDGINHALKVVSNNQIHLGREELPYATCLPTFPGNP